MGRGQRGTRGQPRDEPQRYVDQTQKAGASAGQKEDEEEWEGGWRTAAVKRPWETSQWRLQPLRTSPAPDLQSSIRRDSAFGLEVQGFC